MSNKIMEALNRMNGRQQQPSVFDQLAQHETSKQVSRRAKFNRLYKANGLTGYAAWIFPLSGGNERAGEILRLLLKAHVDPTSKSPIGLTWMDWLELLDLIGIYGAKIVVFYDVICGSDTAKATAVLKAWQLGWLSQEEILKALDDSSTSTIDPEDVLVRVRRAIPFFGTRTYMR